MNPNTDRLEARKPDRVKHTYTQSIHATPDDVFPLLCPVRELDWVPGWQPDWVISESGLVEPGCIFQTPGESEPNTAPAIWVVTEHHPEARRVEMFKVIPGHTVTKLAISLREDGEAGTHATVSFEYTALGPEGASFVETRTEAWYRTFMHGWESAMNRYFG